MDFLECCRDEVPVSLHPVGDASQPVTEDGNLVHVVKVVSAKLLNCKVSTSSLFIFYSLEAVTKSS